MRTALAGVTGTKSRIQVSRTETSSPRGSRPSVAKPIVPLSVDTIITGDCIAEMNRLPAGQRRSHLRRSALQSAARRRAVASRSKRRRCRRRRLGQIRELRHLRPVFARLARRRASAVETARHDLRHRLVSQHLSRRHDAAGSRLLDPQRHHLAQSQSDAEFSRPPVHQRARDDDLGEPRRAGESLHVQLRGAEGRQRRLPGPLRLVPADLHRRRAHQGRRRAQAAPDAKARSAARAHHARREPRRRCRARPVPRLGHVGRRGAPDSGAASSASSAIRPTPPRRARVSRP